MQTIWAVASLICRVVLFGVAVPVLLSDFPNYKLPYRFPVDWTTLVVCDLLAVVVPFLRFRKLTFLIAAATLGAHYYFRHIVPTWDLAYMGVAIVFVLLPSSGRVEGKPKPKTR
jgi:hypothetical protein